MAEFPIAPDLVDGRLVHLDGIVEPAKAKPVPRPAAKLDANGTPIWTTEISARTRNVEVYTKLGVGAAFSGHTTINHNMSVIEGQIGRWATTTDPNALVIRTFWGVGIRMALTYSAFETDKKITAGFVAAHVESKGLQVSYNIESIGLGNRELALVLRAFPSLQKFDMGTYTKFEQARTKLIDALAERMNKPESMELLQPTIVDLVLDPASDSMSEAAEHRFVMQSIAAGMSLNATLARIGANGHWQAIRPEQAEKLYLKHTGDATEPSAEAVSQASNWLQL